MKQYEEKTERGKDVNKFHLKGNHYECLYCVGHVFPFINVDHEKPTGECGPLKFIL